MAKTASVSFSTGRSGSPTDGQGPPFPALPGPGCRNERGEHAKLWGLKPPRTQRACRFIPDPTTLHAPGPVRCRERLGGLLKFYQRAAA